MAKYTRERRQRAVELYVKYEGLRGGCDPRAGVSQPGGVTHVAPGLARRTGDGRVLAAW